MLGGSLARAPEMVNDFMDSLTAELKPRAARDYNTMRKMKKTIHRSSKVNSTNTSV